MLDRIFDHTYRLIEEIGKGGFGAVYRAVRVRSEGMGPVAIKVLNKQSALKPRDYARFQREASLMSQLVHPGIVSVYELGETIDGCFYIVMELVNGSNLRQYVQARGGSLSLPEILDVLIQAAEALEYVHGHLIEHRDIKPQNILVCEKGPKAEGRIQVKLVDFGVARLSPQALGGESQMKSEVVGTYAYMSPEATGLSEEPVDHRSDIYSLGVVAFEMLAGRLPFLRGTAQEVAKAHAQDPLPTISEALGREMSPVLEGIVAKCLAKKPDERYQSVFGLCCDLKTVQHDLRVFGRIRTFDLASKDLDLMARFRTIFVGREEICSRVLDIIGTQKKARLNWVLLRGGVGSGKSRCLEAVRQDLEKAGVRYLYLKFSESEKALPYQALSLAVNDYLTQFEKLQMGEYRVFIEELLRKTGDMAIDLGRHIPSLRPFLAEREIMTRQSGLQETKGSEDPIDYQTRSNRLNQAFKEMFEALAGGTTGQRLVFLVDDIHQIDSATIALLQLLIQQMNSTASFSFVLTIRDKMPQVNPMLDGLLRILAGLRRRFHSLELPRFNREQVIDFLRQVEIGPLTDDFIDFAMKKTDSTPHQLQLLVKQLVMQDVLVPELTGTVEGGFSLRRSKLFEANISLFSIESLIASLSTLGSRDRRILHIAAVCQEPCAFELFKLDSEFSTPELETRLSALVRQGILNETGDENLPIARRSYSVAHEKIRSSVLAELPKSERRQLHFLFVQRIKYVYKKPQREHVLLLARHIDGAGELIVPREAAIGLLRAARICIGSLDHNLARYYIEKASECVAAIGQGKEKLQLLREVLEARYMIYAAQGNLVAASEVCKQLVEVTIDRRRKDKLQLYWAQLQMSLGRHSEADAVMRQLLSRHLSPLPKWIEDLAGGLLRVAAGTRLYAMTSALVARFLFPWIVSSKESTSLGQNCLALMMIAQFHGSETPIRSSLVHSVRLNMFTSEASRWVCLYWTLNAALYLRRGNIKLGFRALERVEKFYSAEGNLESVRWLTSLRSLWFDYPNGRIDRLLQVFSESSSVSYPTSGLLHFETYGLRAWLRLLSPSSLPSRDIDPSFDRRKGRSESRTTVRSGTLGDRSQLGNQEILLESNNARRVLDSGENGQFTSLALFSDAFRFALSDKNELLKRACQQMQRQRSFSLVGEAFEMFGAALLASVTGRSQEVLFYYQKACRRILRCKVEVIALPVTDALRFALIFFPLWSFTLSSRKEWPKHAHLERLLGKIEARLRAMDGMKKGSRNSVSMIYAAMRHFCRGETRNALSDLDNAIREARMQKTDLLECTALSLLAVISAERGIKRAGEHLSSVVQISHRFRWNLIERMSISAARRFKVKLDDIAAAHTQKTSFSSRGRSTQVAINHLMKNLQLLIESPTIDALVRQTTKVAVEALKVSSGYLFLKDRGGSSRFKCRARYFAGQASSSVDEELIVKWLPSQLDEYVKLVPLESPVVEVSAHGPHAGHGGEPSVATVSFEPDEAGNDYREQTTITSGTAVVAPLNPRSVFPSSRSHELMNGRFLTIVALANQGELLGWIALPDVSGHFYNASDMEQELTILGLHVGYLISRFIRPATDQPFPLQPASQRLADEHSPEFPPHVYVEEHIAGKKRAYVGWKAFGIRQRVVLSCAWRIRCSSDRVTRRLNDLVGRHLTLFAQSLRQQVGQLDTTSASERLVSDFTAVLESSQQQGHHLNVVDFNFVFFDLESKVAREGVFGAEVFSFTGDSRVVHESLEEMHGLLAGHQSLIFRERTRQVTGHCGWAFGLDRESRISLYRFADVDFMERYLPLIREQQKLLPESLGISARDLCLFALFALDPDLTTGVGGSGARVVAH
jgi:hypothetical protein